jgi:hypothetical protein|tara:strand:+ start:1093 stop:1266 length:174 start_codon:yes stop_codon:yes gene_type:complete
MCLSRNELYDRVLLSKAMTNPAKPHLLKVMLMNGESMDHPQAGFLEACLWEQLFPRL